MSVYVTTPKPLSRSQIRRALKRLKCSLRSAAAQIGKSPAIVSLALNDDDEGRPLRVAGPTLDALRALIAEKAASEVNVHVNTKTMTRRVSQGQTLPRHAGAHPVRTRAASREANGGRM